MKTTITQFTHIKYPVEIISVFISIIISEIGAETKGRRRRRRRHTATRRRMYINRCTATF